MIIQRCVHCDEKTSKDIKLYQHCKLKSQRQKMDEANREVFKKAGLEFHYKYCEKEAK